MAWSSDTPLGTVSVKANKSLIKNNFAYIESLLGNSVVGSNTTSTRDHFFNVGVNVSGRHRFIQSPKFVDNLGATADPALGTSMDGVLYMRSVSVSDTTVQGFYKNAAGVAYQYIPTFKTGEVTLDEDYTEVLTVPASVYGEIFMFRSTTNGSATMQYGYFQSTATKCDAWAVASRLETSSDPKFVLIFANGADASGLKIFARTSQASEDNSWNYRITYRAI